MKPTLAMLAFTVLTAATGAAHANGKPSSDVMGAYTTVVEYPLAIEAQNQNQRSVAEVMSYVCDNLQLPANPHNAFIKAKREAAESTFYTMQGKRITHPLDLAAIQMAKCKRKDKP